MGNSSITQSSIAQTGASSTVWVMSTLSVEILELPPLGTNCYVLASEESQRLAVFDAPLNAFKSVETRQVRSGYELEGLYFTHGHWDHMLDGHHFQSAGTETFGHEADREFFEDPACMRAFALPGLGMEPVRIDHWLQAAQDLEILGRPVEIRHIPGHSAGSVLFWFREDGFVISGDALFRGGVGRTDFPGCSFGELAASIRNEIYSLPDETIVYPGHGPETTVGEEKRRNPFVAA